MLDLHGFTTGNTYRAAVALEESGLAYRQIPVNLGAGEHKGAAYRLVNATGRVPTLVDPDGPGGQPLVLTQSNAIILYVAEKSGKLLPESALDRARAFEWFFFFITDVIAPTNQGSFLKRSGIPEAEPAARRLDEQAVSMYAHVEQRLEQSEYLAGNTFSIADIPAYTVTSYLKPHRSAELPAVKRWMETVASRPGVQRGMAAFRQ
ncbi:MAG TPA: glutathione S-transferase family protein [Polyangiaceae bacterium]|jgi:GST-like protein|nr:glutathione S-transferase family protein [Polyangiaceae bacterium]